MLFKLAFRNVRRQFSSYAIYFITVAFTITMIFSVNNIIQGDIMSSLLVDYFSGTKDILTAVTGFLALIMVFVLGYATNFLLKKRKKEFALYLVMGMNRRHIIGIFMLETAITFVLALCAGLLLGLLFYQVLMAIFINYIQLDYTLTGYSPIAFVYTIGIVCVVFFLSSAASASYLRFEKISKLLNSEKIAEKTVRYPLIWLIVAIAGIVGVAVFMHMFILWLNTVDFFQTFFYGAIIIVLTGVSIIFGSMGLCKGITWLMVKARGRQASGTGMFTARQLSGSATANSVMVGLLSLLMSLVIIGPNIFLSISNIYTERVNDMYLYDISGSVSTFNYTQEQIEEMENELTDRYLGTISGYAEIENYVVYYLYETSSGQQWDTSYDYYVTYNDFLGICKVLGYTLPKDIGQKFECQASSSTSDPFEWSGGMMYCPEYILERSITEFTVVPDAEVEEGGFEPVFGALCIDLKDGRFDARALDAKLNPIDANGNRLVNMYIKENERLNELGGGGLFLLGDLYASAVFLLLTLGILSLKMLSMVSEDKQKYKTLYKLGATRAQLFRSLLAQLVFFCCLPFIIPVFMNLPLLSIISLIYYLNGFEMSFWQVVGQLSGITFAMLGVCFLYLVAASIVAWQDIGRSLRESG